MGECTLHLQQATEILLCCMVGVAEKLIHKEIAPQEHAQENVHTDFQVLCHSGVILH